jgi:pyruvate,water dikinase
MPNSLVFLGTEIPHGTASIGHKAAHLNQLALAGFPVPPGFCLPTSVFIAALAPSAAEIDALCAHSDLHHPAVAQTVAHKIADLLADLRLPVQLDAELALALSSFSEVSFAVRSSATLEDLAGASFAGQYATVLGVPNLRSITDAILICWRSYFSANALVAQARYANQQTIALAANRHGMAVLIQPLLNADCAGVCFTVDPVRPHSAAMLMTAAWGLGSGVVEGSVPADTIRLHRADLGVVETRLADKHTCIQAAPGGGVQANTVPDGQRRLACLPERWLQRIAQFGLAAEQHFGRPQDVEWAIANGQVWILQSRPITTLPTEVQQATAFPIAWANEAERTRSWWLESKTHRDSSLLLPAEIEFIRHNSSGGQAAVEYAGGAKTRWRKVVNGRVYMAVADSPVGPGEQRIRQAAMQDLLTRLPRQNMTLWEYWGPEIVRATERLDEFDGRTADGPTLAAHLEDTLAAAQRHWMIHTMMPRFSMFEPLLRIYMQLTGKSWEVAKEELAFFLQGEETAQTHLVEMLYALAEMAHQQPALAALLQDTTLTNKAVRLGTLTVGENFVQGFAQLMKQYGGRMGLFTQGNDGESPVEVPLPWREVPDHLLAMIAIYLPLIGNGQDASPGTARVRAQDNWQHKVDQLCAAASDATLAERFRQELVYARRNAAFLDEHNHYIDQLSEGQFAQALVYAGRWLAARGDLPHPYTVFWLRPDEILSALRSSARQDFSAQLAERQAEFEQWRQYSPPPYIGLPLPQLPERPPTVDGLAQQAIVEQPSTTKRLLGQAVSAGKRAGRARIIPQTSTLPEVTAGDVLVATHAPPLWTPIFPALAGLVLAAGGVGEHAAITVREFGIPAVFSVSNAPARIPPGAWVTVDGDSGVVTWE